MKSLKLLFDFYLKSSIHVGCAVFCLTEITFEENYLESKGLLSFLTFFGTVLGYNFLKYGIFFKIPKATKRINLALKIVTFLAAIGLMFTFYSLPITTKILVLIAGLLVLLYPFVRKIGWLKMFMVSIVVTFVTVYLPYYQQQKINTDVLLSLIQRFLIIMGLLVPFEIMDASKDRLRINTLPQLLGSRYTKLIGFFFVCLFMAIDFFTQKLLVYNLFIALITVLFIFFTNQKRSDYFTKFWVESAPVFWLIVVLIVKYCL